MSSAKRLRVLIYKRTHTGDPTPEGVFGLSDCMGRVRAREYEAAIGVGGTSAEPQACGIAGRITWVGVGARRSVDKPVGHRGPIVQFDRFRLFDATGPMLDILAPALAHHLFRVNRRVVMSDSLNSTIQREIAKVLALASLSTTKRTRTLTPKSRCPPKRARAGVCPPTPAKASICPPRRRPRTC